MGTSLNPNLIPPPLLRRLFLVTLSTHKHTLTLSLSATRTDKHRLQCFLSVFLKHTHTRAHALTLT